MIGFWRSDESDSASKRFNDKSTPMIFETFAYRKKLESRGEQADVYTYDNAPKHLRHQICLALREGIGRFYSYSGNEFDHVNEANEVWCEIDRICTKEIESYLSYQPHDDDLDEKFLYYIMNVIDVDDFLSAVEIGCIALTVYFDQPHARRGARESSREALKEINKRFEQHAVGYQFENRRIIRIDSKVAHAEIVNRRCGC